MPTADDFAQSLAIVLGFNVAKLPGALKRRIADSGKTSERYLKDMPRDEIIELAKVLKEPQSAESNDLSNRKATIEKSTETAKASNLTDKIKIEPAREKITDKKPENIDKSTESIQKDLLDAQSKINDLPKGNKKNLAKEAMKRGYVSTPEQLDLFLDEYEATYQGIPGKTGLSKNRKFMNKYAETNKQQRDIKQISDKPVVDIKPTSERVLEIGRQQKREAKFEDNKAKLKEAKKRIDLSKRKIENQKREASKTPEAAKENVKPEENILPEDSVLTKPESVRIGSEGGKSTASISVYRDGAYQPHKIEMTKAEKELVDASNA